MDDRMIMFTHDGLTFMYRVGGIAIHDGRVLVEQAVRKGFCFLPGGRVEFGENAIAALQREIREELGEQARSAGCSSPPTASSSSTAGVIRRSISISWSNWATTHRSSTATACSKVPSPTSCSSGSR